MKVDIRTLTFFLIGLIINISGFATINYATSNCTKPLGLIPCAIGGFIMGYNLNFIKRK